MDRDVRIDLRAIADIDVTAGKAAKMGRVQPSLPLESKVLEGTLKAYIAAAGGSPTASLLNEAVQFANSPARAFAVLGALKRAPTRPAREFTIAPGPSLAAGAGGMLDLAFGVYFWNKPNIGIYGSFAAGYVSNIGASITGQVTYLFSAAPDVLSGDCIMVGVECRSGHGSGFDRLRLSRAVHEVGVYRHQLRAWGWVSANSRSTSRCRWRKP